MDVCGRWWTLLFVRPSNLDADGRPRTFWKPSQGAGIETRTTHQEHQKNWLFVLVDPNGRNNVDLERQLTFDDLDPILGRHVAPVTLREDMDASNFLQLPEPSPTH